MPKRKRGLREFYEQTKRARSCLDRCKGLFCNKYICSSCVIMCECTRKICSKCKRKCCIPHKSSILGICFKCVTDCRICKLPVCKRHSKYASFFGWVCENCFNTNKAKLRSIQEEEEFCPFTD